MISAAARARIEENCALFPERRGGLLAALHLVQEEHGHVGYDAMRELAELFAVPPIAVLELVRFHSMLASEARGRHAVFVCRSLSCALRGGRALLADLETHLGVKAGETTPDGRVTLGHEECVGACDGAPVLRIGAATHEGLDAQAARALVDGLE